MHSNREYVESILSAVRKACDQEDPRVRLQFEPAMLDLNESSPTCVAAVQALDELERAHFLVTEVDDDEEPQFAQTLVKMRDTRLSIFLKHLAAYVLSSGRASEDKSFLDGLADKFGRIPADQMSAAVMENVIQRAIQTPELNSWLLAHKAGKHGTPAVEVAANQFFHSLEVNLALSDVKVPSPRAGNRIKVQHDLELEVAVCTTFAQQVKLAKEVVDSLDDWLGVSDFHLRSIVSAEEDCMAESASSRRR